MTLSLIIRLSLILLLAPSIAGACRGGEQNPPNTLKEAYQGASIVFMGKMISIESARGKNVRATFEIVQSWKGPKTGTISFPLETGRSCDIGNYVEKGSKWFVIANKPDEVILTGSHSRRLFDLKEEEKKLIEIQKAIGNSER